MSSLLTRCGHPPNLCLCLVCHISSHACSPYVSPVPPFLLIPLSPVSAGCSIILYICIPPSQNLFLSLLSSFPPTKIAPAATPSYSLPATATNHTTCTQWQPPQARAHPLPVYSNFFSYSIQPSPFPFIFTDQSSKLNNSHKMEHKHGASFSL